MQKIGLIAGGGQFPIIFAQKARINGFQVVAAAYRNEVDPGLEGVVDAIEWFHLGQVKRLLRFFHRNGVTQTVMLGTIRKTRLFTDVKPDIKALAMVAKMRHTHDDGILRAFAGLLEKEGIHVRPSTFLLPELLAPAGVWTRRKPTRDERKDMALGWRIAKAIGRLDIGQCIVVGGGSVLAVEAIDGTDATITRGGQLARGEAVVVKVCKPEQDTRFDIPAIGVATIETMQAVGARALAVEADRAVAFDRHEMIAAANDYGMAVVALTGADDPIIA
ncbi:MAG: UDP-2,3-diacylglucosamine diphosphatase LpxI [Desulfosarcinaceae bacterium]|nr:UDP-2,3-diacylglucosamine diphosphatase LpxI [Desulfosarcinaceae bacterium]